ncbi:MAG: hypothetical protein QXZ54_02420 [Candidatus Methanomethylicia archaeon]
MITREYTFKRAFIETMMGLILSTILQAIFFLYIHHQQPYTTIMMIHIINALTVIFLSFITPFLSMSYTLGWTFGTYVLQSAKFIDLTEHIIYLILVIPVVTKLIKEARWKHLCKLIVEFSNLTMNDLLILTLRFS